MRNERNKTLADYFASLLDGLYKSIENSKNYFVSWSTWTKITVFSLSGFIILVGVLFSYPALFNKVAMTFGAKQFDGTFVWGIPALIALIIAGVLETGWSFSINQMVFSFMKKAYFAMLFWLLICASFLSTSVYFQNEGASEFAFINTEKPKLVGSDKKAELLKSKDGKVTELNAKIDAIEKQGNDLLAAIDKINSNPNNFYKSEFSGRKVMRTNAEIALLSAEQRYENWEDTKDKRIESLQKQIEQAEKNNDALISSIDSENGAKVDDYNSRINKTNQSSKSLNVLLAVILVLLILVGSLHRHFKGESDFIEANKRLKDMEKNSNEEYELFMSVIDKIEKGTSITTREVAKLFNKGENNTSHAKNLWNKYKDTPKLQGKSYDQYFGNTYKN